MDLPYRDYSKVDSKGNVLYCIMSYKYFTAEYPEIAKDWPTFPQYDLYGEILGYPFICYDMSSDNPHLMINYKGNFLSMEPSWLAIDMLVEARKW